MFCVGELSCPGDYLSSLIILLIAQYSAPGLFAL